ncbi:TonB-dependent receptor [Minicystis rosea]|nr:TonB-dependent receptor [Minicystis rosea]
MKGRALPWLLVGLALVSRAAQADEPSAPPPKRDGEAKKAEPPKRPRAPIEVVVTGTRTPESTQRATIRTDVVTREEAERRGATNVGEALQGQLGVQVNPSAYGSLGNPSAIQMQGLDGQRVLILEDGERVIGDVGGVIDLASIPLTDVSRIEMVTGPTSSLYGTSAIGGVVNVLSAPPEAQGPSGRMRAEGRYPWGALIQGTGAYRRGDSWVRLDSSFQHTAAISLNPESIELAIPRLNQHLIGLRAGTRLGSRLTVQARARWIRDVSLGRSEQVVPQLGTYRIDLPERTDRIALHLAQTVDLGGGSSLRVTAARQWAYNQTSQDRFESPLDEIRNRSTTLSSMEAIGTIADGPRTWVVGVRAEVENLQQGFTRTELVQGVPTTIPQVEVPQTTLGSAALYGQLAYKILDKLTLLPGVRGEMHLRYGAVVAPRLAVAYRPTDSVTIRVSGGRGFRAPSAKEFGFAFDHSIYGYRVTGNPNLKPESSWGVNGGVTVKPVRDLTLSGGVFANWIKDLIDVDLNPTSTTGGIQDYTYRNVGSARTFGWQIDLAWKASSWLRTEAGYAYLWTRDDTLGRPLQGRPPHTVYSSLRGDLPARIQLYLRWRAVTDAYLEDGLRTVGFQTIDARVSRPIWPGSLAYVGVLNALGAQKDPLRLGDQRPIAGRTFYLGFTAELPWENEP